MNYRVNGKNLKRSEVKALKRQQAEARNEKTKPEDRKAARKLKQESN